MITIFSFLWFSSFVPSFSFPCHIFCFLESSAIHMMGKFRLLGVAIDKLIYDVSLNESKTTAFCGNASCPLLS